MTILWSLFNFKICDTCGEALASLRSLETHRKLSHNPAASVLVCNECGKTLSRKSFKHHVDLHTLEYYMSVIRVLLNVYCINVHVV